ncbi:hypothetical protein HHI36_019961 [Cryptolaemus montrouzieri]|uniref:Uncharacterized protein n=1 Tax=Cryptolaemus montrouzieri TaxID=559131 RepID=A0ABD2N960_9CUCU
MRNTYFYARSTDFFLEEPESCDWDGDVALKNDELPESAQEPGILSLDLQQSIDIELIGIDESDLQLSNSSPNSSFLVHTSQGFLASNSGSEKDNDGEDPNYEFAAEEHFNDEASEESAPTLEMIW